MVSIPGLTWELLYAIGADITKKRGGAPISTIPSFRDMALEDSFEISNICN